MNVKCLQVEDDRNIRVMLLNPPPENRRDMHDTPGHPHLGLAYISGYLKNKGINCTAIDAKFEMIELAGLERRLLHINEQPDVVGITAMTHEISQANKTKVPMNTWLKQGLNPAIYSVVAAGLDTAGYVIQKT